MALRPEYSLGHSQYNDFLFSSIGEEKTGTLTVLSALTRLGLDPWQEAARLADMPRPAAIRSFAITIADLPPGDWTASDTTTIAARSVAWLPAGSISPIPTLNSAPPKAVQTKLHFAPWLAWCALAVVLILLLLHLISQQ
jgi:hypothetical protein